MLPILAGAAIISGLGYFAYESWEKKSKKFVIPAPSQVPLLGKNPAPGSAPITSIPVKVTPITPAGQTQPPTAVVMPPAIPTPAMGSPVRDTAAKLVTYLTNHGADKNASTECKNFQLAYNGTNPGTVLKADGEYGPKCQAALQAIINPAVAPQNAYGTVVAVPASPAPVAGDASDISAAATNLVAYFTSNKADKNSNQPTRTFQAAYNQHGPAVHLIEDGIYGPKGTGALQAVLDWMGHGDKAPTNAYGKVTKAPPFGG